MTTAYFILGIPVETYQDERNTIEFAKSICPDYVQFSTLSPFPGTKVYEDAIKDGSYREINAQNPLDKDLKRPVIISANWDEQKLQDIVKEAYRSFYFRPGYIWRRLCSFQSWTGLWRALRAGLRIFMWSFQRRRTDAN